MAIIESNEVSMSEGTVWITLATTPPSSQESFDRLATTLRNQKIEVNVEENPVRQCERDPAAWLRVHAHDLPLAWDLARRLNIEPAE